MNYRAGFSNFWARRFDQAIVEFRKAIDIEPRYGFAHAGVAISEAQKGRLAEAVAAAQKGVEVDKSPIVLAMAGGVYAAAGQAGMALKLKEMSLRGFVCALQDRDYPYQPERDGRGISLVRESVSRPACLHAVPRRSTRVSTRYTPTRVTPISFAAWDSHGDRYG